MSTLGKKWDDLPGWAKGGIAVAGLLMAAGIGYGIYRGVKGWLKMADEREEKKATGDEIDKLKKSGVKPTLNPSQIKDMSNQLKTAFEGYGTDKSTVQKVFARVMNDLDMLNLKNAFGIQTISSGKLNPEPDKSGTLGEIMSNEMTVKEIFDINMVLAKRGIKNRI